MFKKIIFATSLFATTLSIAHAAAFYIEPSANVIDVTSPNGSYRGVAPRLAFGYSDMISNEGYFAGELFVTPTSGVLSENTPNSTSLKTTRDFGASIIPGYYINQSVIGFLRFGAITTKFTGPNKYLTGAQFGIGMQTLLTPNWSVRTEYNYITYRSSSSIGTPRSDQFSLGLLYYFI